MFGSMGPSMNTSSLMVSFNYLCAYDLYSPVHNVLDACISITRESRRALGPRIREFLGPVKWQRADSKRGWTVSNRDWTLALTVSK